MLGLDADARPDEADIRRAKRSRSLATHPDKTDSPGASYAFHVVIAASEVLLDSTRRTRYDAGMRAAAGAAGTDTGGPVGCPQGEALEIVVMYAPTLPTLRVFAWRVHACMSCMHVTHTA